MLKGYLNYICCGSKTRMFVLQVTRCEEYTMVTVFLLLIYIFVFNVSDHTIVIILWSLNKMQKKSW